MNLNLIKLSIFVFAFLIFGCVSAYSQNKCSLKIDVYEFKEDGSAEQFPVKDAKIVLKTGSNSTKVRNTNGAFIATDLIEGSYDVAISKKNFKKSEKKISIDCGAADFQNMVTEIAFLWKGPSDQTINMNPNVLGVTRVKSLQSDESDINGKAISLGRPRYSSALRLARANGKVMVEVLINELGYVVSAEAISGSPLLYSTSVQAARESKFKMTTLEGIPVKVKGIISYIFM